MWIPPLGREDPLEEEHGKPTPVFLPGESPGQRSLEGYSPQGHKELVTTEEWARKVPQQNLLVATSTQIASGTHRTSIPPTFRPSQP